MRLLILIPFLCAGVALAKPKHLAYPDGSLPNDERLKPVKDLNGYFPFEVPATEEAWNKRSEKVRLQIKTAVGLHPEPTRTPLNAVIHGKIDAGDYTIEKVYFESLPGFFVTGNLYRPKIGSGKRPGVLCPHGHFPNGRFGVTNPSGSIKSGAEKYEGAGKNVMQARSAQLARMGCTVLNYDMVGYADSRQISYHLAHRFAKQRAEMATPDSWGLYSGQAESWLQSSMALQSWNSIRALDFLESLPDVDPKRLAVTGASGGGTQTFILAAIDPRPVVAFPAVMVSTAMQGGCTCENASLLRVGTGNIEIAALFAPKPLAMTAADDWTKEMETKGFPELKKLYTMLGVPDKVRLHAMLQYGHNYNYPSRAAMYSWFNKHLGLGHEEPIVEPDLKFHPQNELTVWNDDHPAPPGGPEFERKLLAAWKDDIAKKIAADAKVARSGFDTIIGRDFAGAGFSEFDMTGGKHDHGDYLEMVGRLTNTTHGEELPAAFFYPKDWKGRVVVWVSPRGKAAIYDDMGTPAKEVMALIRKGFAVAGVDLLYQGEFLGGKEPPKQTRRVGNTREAAAYTLGYNRSLCARRIHDILTLVRFIKDDEHSASSIDLVAEKGAAHWVAAARLQCGDAVRKTALDTSDGFLFQNISNIRDVDLLPGAARYGDLPGMLKLIGKENLHTGKDSPVAWLAN